MGNLQGLVFGGAQLTPKDVEMPGTFSIRVMRWWNLLVQRHVTSVPALLGDEVPDTRNILVVSHGGTIGLLIEELIGSRKVRRADGIMVGRCLNASVTVIELERNGKGVLVSYADTTHLDVPLVDVNVDVAAV